MLLRFAKSDDTVGVERDPRATGASTDNYALAPAAFLAALALRVAAAF